MRGTGIRCASMIGIIAAVYAFYVEMKMEAAQPPPAPPKGIKTTSSMSMTAETPFSLKAKEDEGPYEAMCDFNIESVGISGSCTKVSHCCLSCSPINGSSTKRKVFGSSYGHILSHWGILEKGHPLDLSLATTGFKAVPRPHVHSIQLLM